MFDHDSEAILARCAQDAKEYSDRVSANVTSDDLKAICLANSHVGMLTYWLKRQCEAIRLLTARGAASKSEHHEGFISDTLGWVVVGFEAIEPDPDSAVITEVEIVIEEVWKGGTNLAQHLSDDAAETLADELRRHLAAKADQS